MKPLQEYHQKRSFRITPEPSGHIHRKRAKQKKLTFVVQEHHATRLHYDFRIELDGVLKSWAVPKGPSFIPGEKRLAVQVEDHPLSYGRFEGRIPAHQYGAGEVYIWDTGTWEPEGNPVASLRKGHLDFVLKGTRMKGRWRLIRMQARDGNQNWLLMKREDTKALPVSREPDFIEPALPTLVDEPPRGRGWIHEMKFDGYRIQAHIENGEVSLFTRSDQDWTEKYPFITDELERSPIPNVIVDGEIVALDRNGKSDFQTLQLAMKTGKDTCLLYYVFDLLYHDGHDLRHLPLLERKEILKKWVRKLDSPCVIYSDHLKSGSKDLLSEACRLGLEGVVSKRVDSPYVSGRKQNWVKSKCESRQEFVIGGYTDPAGSRDYFGALLLGVYEKGKLRYVGRVGTGFDQKNLKLVREKMKKHASSESPFDIASPRERNVHFLKPKLVTEVSFSQWTRDQLLRAPVFHGLREDKSPKEVRHEVEKHLSREARVAAEPLTRDGLFPFTHPDKVFFKKEKITKKNIADFYFGVSQWMLPEISNRPLVLNRCPEGTSSACFYHKHLSRLPPPRNGVQALRSIPIEGHEGEKDYAVMDSDQGLMELVQMAAFEVHAWGCSEDSVEKPDQIVMDFDPGPGVPFARVKRAALELKSILQTLGLKSFLKVTGGKGLHVHVPIAPVYTWNEVKAFTKAISDEMARKNPDCYTASIAKSERPGKIFVDYLRNGRGATAVVPYCLRAKEKSAVAMPIAWSDLKKLKSADQFTMKKAITWIKRRKKDPWKHMHDLQQRISVLDETFSPSKMKKTERDLSP